MNPIVSIFGGIFCLLIGGGLTLYSYVNRDPVSGEYFVWWSLILVGTVSVGAGFIQRKLEE